MCIVTQLPSSACKHTIRRYAQRAGTALSYVQLVHTTQRLRFETTLAARRMPPAFGTADALATLGGSQAAAAAETAVAPSTSAMAEKTQLKPPGEWRMKPLRDGEPPSKPNLLFDNRLKYCSP